MILFRVALACIVVLTPLGAIAHNLGASHEEIVGQYLIDIGYDPIAPVGGDQLLLDLNLWDKEKEQAVEFSSAWVRIEREGKTLLATGVHRPEFGAMTVLTRLPPEGGEVLVSVRFESGLESIAETRFPLTVAPEEKPAIGVRESFFIGAGVLCGVIFTLLYLFYSRKRE